MSSAAARPAATPKAKPRVNISKSRSRTDKLCELCDDGKTAGHFVCRECEQWMCERCRGIHAKQKATRDHVISSPPSPSSSPSEADTQQDLKLSMKGMLKRLRIRVASFEHDLDAYEDGIDAITASRKTAFAESERLRAECHAKLDEQFDALNERIEALIKPRLHGYRKDETAARETKEAMQKQMIKIRRYLDSNESSRDDAKHLLEQAKVMLDVNQVKYVKIKVPQVILQLNPDWTKTEPCEMTSKTKKTVQARQISDDRAEEDQAKPPRRVGREASGEQPESDRPKINVSKI